VTAAHEPPSTPAMPMRPAARLRLRPSGAFGIWVATGVLFLASALVQPQSLSSSSLLGMLPFAAILAVVAARPDALI